MSRCGMFLAACLLCAAVVVASESVQTVPRIVVLHGGHLIDAVAGKRLGPTTVLIDGSRIRSVSAGMTKPVDGADLIDMPDATCMPGLIDSDDTVHLSGAV